jgi:hypothetical protein
MVWASHHCTPRDRRCPSDPLLRCVYMACKRTPGALFGTETLILGVFSTKRSRETFWHGRQEAAPPIAVFSRSALTKRIHWWAAFGRVLPLEKVPGEHCCPQRRSSIEPRRRAVGSTQIFSLSGISLLNTPTLEHKRTVEKKKAEAKTPPPTTRHTHTIPQNKKAGCQAVWWVRLTFSLRDTPTLSHSLLRTHTERTANPSNPSNPPPHPPTASNPSSGSSK